MQRGVHTRQIDSMRNRSRFGRHTSAKNRLAKLLDARELDDRDKISALTVMGEINLSLGLSLLTHLECCSVPYAYSNSPTRHNGRTCTRCLAHFQRVAGI